MRVLRLIVLAAFVVPSFAVSFTLDDVLAMAGATGVAVNVFIASGTGEDVAGVQFDVVCDGGTLTTQTINLGQAAIDADKDLSTNFIDENRVRVLVTGFNQNVIADGIVITVFMDVVGGAASGSYSVDLDSVLLSDPFGFPVVAEVFAGSITVNGTPSEGATEGSSEGSAEGSSEGSSEGMSEGISEGSGEGSSEGSSEGGSEGMSEGTTEGSSEGSAEGSSEGSGEGSGCAASAVGSASDSSPIDWMFVAFMLVVLLRFGARVPVLNEARK